MFVTSQLSLAFETIIVRSGSMLEKDSHNLYLRIQFKI